MNPAEYEFTFSMASKDEFYEIKHFLKRNHTYSANRDDIIYLVRAGATLIGLARLLKIEGAQDALWLRGLYINEQWRSKGIASQLLSALYQSQLTQSTNKTIYAFAEPHLHSFYKHNNYQIIEANKLPASLEQKFNNAQQQGKKWLCLAKKVY